MTRPSPDGTSRRLLLGDTRMRRLRSRLRPRAAGRFGGPSFNRIVPNLLTMLGLCAGLTAIRFALEARFGSAAVAITVAGAIDGLDGRLARLLKATTRFGAEFDSLSDFLCFGVAPAFVIYVWSLQAARGFGFVPCLMFAVCTALRLARFNAELETPAVRASYAGGFSTGVPAPAGAGLALFPLFLGLEGHAMQWPWLIGAARSPVVCAAILIGSSVLLVSTLPVWNFKNVKIPYDYILPLLLGTGLFAALLVADPWSALATAGALYLGMLPFSVRSYRRLQRAPRSIAAIVGGRSADPAAG